MKNDVCLLQSSHLQEAFSESDCAVFHLATCFMCLEWKCTKSHSHPGDKEPCHTTQLGVSEPVRLVPVPGPISLGLELHSHGHGRNTHCKTGSCSKFTGAQGHCMQILYLCMMLWIPWVISASWQCCYCWEKPGSLPCLVHPFKSFETSRRKSSCSHTESALFLPATSPAMRLGPKQILYGSVKSTAEAKPGK